MTTAGVRRVPSTDQLAVAAFGLFGLLAGLRPIHDNSALTHLATGRTMAERGWIPHVPKSDPYSFTAAGHDWVVQSWLPSFAVGWTERLGGLHAVLLLNAAAMAVLALLLAMLVKTGRPPRTVAGGALVLVIGASSWAPRPLIVGLLCIALATLVAERDWAPLWLVPLGWIWVQSHGSFPLGLAFFGLRWIGALADPEDRPGAGKAELRALFALTAGVALGGLSPVGPRIVSFPLTVLQKRDVFRHIVEWQPVKLDRPAGFAAAAALAVAVVILVRCQPGWKYVVPSIVFGALGLYTQRNLPVASVVIAPAIGAALRARPVLQPRQDRVLASVAGGLMAVVAIVFVFQSLRVPALALQAYPRRSVEWAETNGRFDAPHRVAGRELVGNYLEFARGPRNEVFIDDRVDMFPESVVADYFLLLKGGPDALRVVATWGIDTVIWPTEDRLVDRLRRSGWRVTYTEPNWSVLVRD